MDSFKTYFKKHFAVESLLESPEKGSTSLSFNSYQLPLSKRLVMYALQMSPWLCLLGFSGTFGMILLAQLLSPASGGFWANMIAFHQENSELIRAFNIVSVSGLIGYGTNYIAIRMLFRPIEKRPIWGQGLIPAQRDRIIYTLAQGMHKHIFNRDLIRRRVEETGVVSKINDLLIDGSVGLIRDTDLRSQVKATLAENLEGFAERDDIRQHIREVIDVRLEENLEGGVKKFLLQTYKRYNKEDYAKAIDGIVADIPKVALEVLEKLEGDLDSAADYLLEQRKKSEEQIMETVVGLLEQLDRTITDLLAKQMAHFDEAKLERMVWEATNEQLLYIQYLGTILGILGGLLIWRPEWMGPVYVLGFGLLFLLDKGIYWLKNRQMRTPESDDIAAPVLEATIISPPIEKKEESTSVEPSSESSPQAG
ncbi:MAG: DUF445 family protein [Bacteroidota bacterium]